MTMRRGGTVSWGLMMAIAVLSSCQERPDDAPRAAAGGASSTSVRARWPVNKTVSYTLELTTVSDTGQSPVAVQLTLVATPELTFRASGSGYQGQVAMTGVRLLDHAKRDAAGSEQLASSPPRSGTRPGSRASSTEPRPTART